MLKIREQNKIWIRRSPNLDPTANSTLFEMLMGVNPGTITGDTSALKKVEVFNTKKYNFGAIDGMGARSADFKTSKQNNLKSAFTCRINKW